MVESEKLKMIPQIPRNGSKNAQKLHIFAIYFHSYQNLTDLQILKIFDFSTKQSTQIPTYGAGGARPQLQGALTGAAAYRKF